MNNSYKPKSFALFAIALLILSATIMMMPIKAQDENSAHGGGVTIGTPTIPFTGGPVPAGVTPSVTIATIPYISFSPNPIGVGQQELVNVWTQPALTVARAHTGYSVIITKPDGSETTVGPFVSYQGDSTAWFTFIPDVVGNYTLQFFFAGDYYPAGYYLNGIVNNTAPALSAATSFNATKDSYYAASQTSKYTLTVQQDQVTSWPTSPLPGVGTYWSKPISPNNRDWWLIGGNDPSNQVGGGTGTPGWPDNTNIYTSPISSYEFVPYTTGPMSAHIVWRTSTLVFGGIFGGLIDNSPSLYEAPTPNVGPTVGTSGPGTDGNPNIVWEGRCFQSIVEPFNGVNQQVWKSFDIQTGKVYWELTNITQVPTLISYAQTSLAVPGAASRADRTSASLVYIGPSATSGLGLVVKYNPMTGAVVSNSTIPLTSGTLYADPYVLSVQTLGTGANTTYRLVNWTLDALAPGATYTTVPGVQSNFTLNLISNITWPFATLGKPDYESMISATTYSSSSPATGIAIPTPPATSNVYIAAASLITGQLLFNVSSGIPYPTFTSNDLSDHGKYAVRFDDGYWYAFDLHTGALAWKSELSSYPWGTFGAYAVESAYGLLYYGQYDGVVAYNWTNGKVAWRYSGPALPFETPYTNGTGNLNGEDYSFFTGGILANDVLYTWSVEHSPTAPLTRGFSIYAINATTGSLIWTTLGPMDPGVVSGGYMTATNMYDGYMYIFGMGLSATTVSAPQTQIASGQNLIISGSVLDQSPAQPGTPAISDASMGDWMAYLHQQSPYPSNVTGVPVSLDTVDPNGNNIHIATVTTNALGNFGYAWTAPAITGVYTITATYAGSNSYGFSSANTYTDVVAPTATTTPTQTLAPSNLATTTDIMTYIVLGVIAIIIAIAIVGIVLFRKHA